MVMTFVNSAEPGLVSVHLPVRNGERHIAEAVESILAQSLRDFELVLVDHSSTDGTPGILSDFAGKDGRVNLLRYEGDNFIESLNFGLSRCRGEFIARMDSDDISSPERLELQLGYLRENPGIAVVGSGVEIFGEDVMEGYRRYEEWINSISKPDEIKREIFVESPLPNPSVMMRRVYMERMGGYEDHGWPEDYDLWLRSVLKGEPMAKLPEKLLRWREHGKRLTRNSRRYSKKSFLKVRAYYLTRFLEGRKIVLHGTGPTGKILGRYLLDYGADLKAYLDINPRKAGGTKNGLPVYPASEKGRFRRDGYMLLAAVTSWGARDDIKSEAEIAGYVEGVDFICCS
ncbi:MAG: glycosyltransferase [Nitrospinota bacterium]|nr:glycosyltransferase [Nitrospinota bacterium]